MTPSDSSPMPGETFLVTVSLSQAATQAEQLNISSATPSNLAAYPASVAVNVGDTSETFAVTVASSASGSLQMSAAMSTGNVSMIAPIAPVSQQSNGVPDLLSSARF